jgi:hypothetical protein
MRRLSFAEFWPLYLRAHRRRATRAAHYAGVIGGTMGAGAAVLTLELWPLAAGVGAAFGLSVGSHWLFEGNRPLLRLQPAWSALSDLRMFYLAMSGGLGREMARQGLDLGAPPLTSAAPPCAVARPTGASARHRAR